MNEIVNAARAGDAPTSWMKPSMNMAQAQVPKGHEPWRAQRDVGSKCKLMARAKMRCSSLDRRCGRRIVSISHAHRNRISMIIIMSRKTGKPPKPRKPHTRECKQMNCQMLRHRFMHSSKTFPNLSRPEWVLGGGARCNQQAYTLFLWRMVSYFRDCQRLSLFPIQSVLIFSSR